MNERVEDQTEQPAPVAADDWRERLNAELKEQSEKIAKLSEFLTKVEDGKVAIDPVSHGLLVAQHGAMTAYQAILFIRANTTVRQAE